MEYLRWLLLYSLLMKKSAKTDTNNLICYMICRFILQHIHWINIANSFYVTDLFYTPWTTSKK